MPVRKNKIFSNPFFIAGILALIIVVITLQSLNLKPKTFVPGGIEYTHYNNYLIFKQSFFHLIEHKDLYQAYPEEHWDYFKYSPTFSLFMAPLAILPDALGLSIWNLLNGLVLFFALWKLPVPNVNKRLMMAGFVLIELITSLQNSQSNGLIAGLIIFAFIFLEKKQIALASLFIVLTIFIKLFGLVALALFIFYPDKLKALISTVIWVIILAILPLIVIPFSQLTFLYQSWFALLQNDHGASLGFSVSGWLNTWFGIENRNVVLLSGVISFCLPLLKFKFFQDIKFRLFFLASVLIWIVIFNHKAESPTFVIAITGVAIWYFSQKMRVENLVLLIIAFVFTILSLTDIFPKNFKTGVVIPYVLKAVPCILIWIKIIADLLLYSPDGSIIEEHNLT